VDAEAVTRDALAAQLGDQAAAARFVRATQAEVWRLVAHLGGREVADDLTQETYLRAFGALPRFAGRSSARTWLLVIARRVCADHVRAAARGRREVPARPAVTADISDQVVLRALVEGLPGPRREAFVLTQLLGLGYDEAAAVCGCPVGTIRSRVARARDDLVRALSPGRGQRDFPPANPSAQQ
jgi:RNA polymerase sigma-70 factor (ECF subfamily)